MLEEITTKNAHYLDAMIEGYEEEFSPITGKERNEEGKFTLDVDWRVADFAAYWIEENIRVGFCIQEKVEGRFDIAEFYVAPSYRGAKAGEKMAFALFNQFKGSWQVRQIEGAEGAKAFWRKVIAKYTGGSYVELQLQDPKWGPITCQRFVNL